MPRPSRHSTRLKKSFKDRFDAYPESTRIRVHRAISWLARAEAEPDDHDARFLFLWIAFNAAYAREFGVEGNARDQLKAFFDHLLALDTERRLATLQTEQFIGPIRTMIGNRFVFEPFWRALREHDASERWKEQFDAAAKRALRRARRESRPGSLDSVRPPLRAAQPARPWRRHLEQLAQERTILSRPARRKRRPAACDAK